MLTVFNIDNKINVSWAANQRIRMILKNHDSKGTERLSFAIQFLNEQLTL